MPRWEVTRQPLANPSSERHLKQQLLPRKDTATGGTERNSSSKCRAVDAHPRWGLYWDDSRPCDAHSVLVNTNVKGLRRSMPVRNPFASGRVNRRRPTIRALQQQTPWRSRKLPFRTALIAPRGSNLVRNRRGLQTWRCLVVRERRIQITLRAASSGLCALLGLTRPIALVRDRRARVGRRGYRHQRQQQ